VGGFAWDLGDGKTVVTDEPRVRHEYPVVELGAHEVRAHRVVVEAHGLGSAASPGMSPWMSPSWRQVSARSSIPCEAGTRPERRSS
jgi:hypothetical protein